MEHWTEKWLGRQWAPGYDCADFVQEVLAAEFGRLVDFPAHAASSTARDIQIDDLRGDYAVRTAAPVDGDGALMREAGAQRRRRYHIGIVAIHGGAVHVLHCSRDLGAVLCRTADLAAHGLELEGFYRWT